MIDTDKTLWGTLIYGPDRFGRYRFTVEGYMVPRIFMYQRGDTNGQYTIRFDERWEMDIDPADIEQVYRWVYWIAQMMAVSAGYPCMGSNDKRSPYATSVIGITPMDMLMMGDEPPPEPTP